MGVVGGHVEIRICMPLHITSARARPDWELGSSPVHRGACSDLMPVTVCVMIRTPIRSKFAQFITETCIKPSPFLNPRNPAGRAQSPPNCRWPRCMGPLATDRLPGLPKYSMLPPMRA